MKIRHALLAACTLVIGSQMLPVAEADDAACDLTYTRTACPGQEAESFKKCDGKASCTKHVAAASEAACVQAAIQACSNDRLEITKSKVINAKYQGKALKTPSGKDDMCLDYPKRDVEFNQCSKAK